MIPLETIRVASPCHADWDEMQGNDQARFCNGCRKNVYNLSEMTTAEAQALVNRLEGKLCVRFYTRTDGTLLTQDCPVGLRAVRRKLVKKLSFAAALLISCGSGLLRGGGMAQAVTTAKKAASPTKAKAAQPPHRPACTAGTPVLPQRTMGKIALPAQTMGEPVSPPPPEVTTMGFARVVLPSAPPPAVQK